MNAQQTALVAAETSNPAATQEDVRQLRESFDAFTRMTSELERAYDRLTRRSSRIDVELARANRELSRKVAELEGLSETRRRMLAALPAGVVVVDPAGCVLSVNPAAERLLGRPAVELEGRLRDAVVGPDGDALLLSGSDPDRGSGAPVEREVVALDGSRRRLSLALAALPDGCEMQVMTDLTVLTRLREQVGRLDGLAALGEMAAGIAHEIRNPLNGIDGFAALLPRALEGALPDNAARYIENIRRGVREVDSIISNLLTYAAPERLRAEAVRLAPLLREVADQARGFAAADPEVDIVADVAPEVEDLVLRADLVKLRIVAVNLTKNAIEAGARAVRLRLEAPRRGRAAILVEDDAGGVPPEMRERLFQPFATSKARGTGLGLAIAQKFVALHGGRLEYREIPGGSRFRVDLPDNHAEEASDR